MNATVIEHTTLRIGSPGLRRALIAGARRVIARRDELNRINVFPVADGDTGSNMAFTLSSVLTGALSRRAMGVGELMRRVSEDASRRRAREFRGHPGAVPDRRHGKRFRGDVYGS